MVLFPNTHPIVEEDVDRLTKATVQKRRNEERQYDLQTEPTETKPKWLKEHWQKMEELKVVF